MYNGHERKRGREEEANPFVDASMVEEEKIHKAQKQKETYHWETRLAFHAPLLKEASDDLLKAFDEAIEAEEKENARLGH